MLDGAAHHSFRWVAVLGAASGYDPHNSQAVSARRRSGATVWLWRSTGETQVSASSLNRAKTPLQASVGEGESRMMSNQAGALILRLPPW